MKAKHILITISLFLMSSLLFAQPSSEGGFSQRSEKIKAMKVEFITTKLELTPAEAEKFWPLYNEFTDKMQVIAKDRRKTMRANKDKELTDKEVNELIQLNFDTDQKMLDLRRAYDVKFKKVLSIQKVGKLYQAEEQFKHELLRKMKGNGPGGKGQKGEGSPR